MRNLKVSQKLIISFLTVILLSVIVGVIGIIGMNSLNNASSSMYSENLLAVEAMANLREMFASERNDIRNMYLSKDDPEKVQSLISGFEAYAETAEKNFALYESSITDQSAESDYYAAKEAYLGDFAKIKEEIFSLAEQGRFDESYAIFMNGSAVITPITNGLSTSAARNDEWAKQADSDTNALFSSLTILLLAFLVIAVVISMFLALYISGMISKPVGALTAFMKRAGGTGDISLGKEDEETITKYGQNKDEIGQCISSTASFVKHVTMISQELDAVAGGDLSIDVKLLSDKDVMGLSMAKMLDNLNNMFSEINASTAQVATGSKQIAEGSQTLAQGSTEQAAAVEELSSSISEIAHKTKANADMAVRAANLANAIKQNAEKGSTQMDQMMGAVKEINQASQSINNVIKVIDDIAFQTNILALNAAVEAARAGQHGKGFAVVAEEVRNLAAKSADAAKDTGGLIANSMEKAELGARIADETASSLVEIVSGINESNQLVSDIARSSEEQSEGISQINKGIDQVAQVIQQNSATAEESAAASEEMSGQSDMLEQMVAQFKLRDDAMRSRELPSASSLPKKRIAMPDVGEFEPTGTSGEYGKY